MVGEHQRPRRVAVLIDGENVSPRAAERVFEETVGIGDAQVRRVYGDFASGRLPGWCEAATRHAILPQQVIASAAGKNAADIALVIDAVDLLHGGRVDAFCIVSSDGDFTRLAARIREQGVDVYGFGERKAPESFRQACKRFVCIEPCPPNAKLAATPTKPSAAAVPKQPPTAAIASLRAALEDLEGADGWYFLGALGTLLAKTAAGFDPRAFGCAKLVTLVERSGAFDVRRQGQLVHIRPR